MTSKLPTILHVIDTTGPGGAETVFTQLADACNKNGYRSIAVIRGAGWVEDQLKKLNVEYHIIDCKGSFNLRFLWALVRLIRKEKIQTLQSHLLGSNVYCSLAGLLTRVMVVSTFHGHVDISPNERFRTAKFALVAAGSKVVVSVTEDLGYAIRAMGNKRLANKTQVIANGIDVNELGKLPIQRLNVGSGSKVIFGSLGNIRPAKNYMLAVDFIYNLVSSGVDAELRLAGDDTKKLAQELREYIAEKKLIKQVKLFGFIDNVPEFFNGIDVFLMTSSSEGHPLALTQAMAAGKPILTTPSGVEEIVKNGETAFISKQHTAESLFSCFSEMQNVSASKLEVIVNQSRLLAQEKYSLSAMCQNYFELYSINHKAIQ